jgi:uncharacterized protein YheU (UPF0270 family)
MKPLVIPHEELNPDTLRAMLEDFVTRNGTEYGEIETPIAERIDFVLRQLRAGKAFILYDAESASFTIGSREQMTTQEPFTIDNRSASHAIDD